MTEEQRKMFQQWLRLNGGKEGTLYKTFPDEELEFMFIAALHLIHKPDQCNK